jgi:hypothetical protein
VFIHEGLATPIRQEGFLYERSIILVLVARKGGGKEREKETEKEKWGQLCGSVPLPGLDKVLNRAIPQALPPRLRPVLPQATWRRDASLLIITDIVLWFRSTLILNVDVAIRAIIPQH